MVARIQEVSDAALKLPARLRAKLVEQLLASLEPSERETIDAAWAVEADDRVRAFDKGQLKAFSAATVFNRRLRRK